MPIYEYRCADCSREFEKMVWKSEEKSVRCPYCGGEKVIRILSAFSRSGGRTGGSLSASCGPSSGGFS